MVIMCVLVFIFCTIVISAGMEYIGKSIRELSREVQRLREKVGK